ncbi:MAG: hypothetical protein ACOC93_05590, partial [Planctomycetota bacterium]
MINYLRGEGRWQAAAVLLAALLAVAGAQDVQTVPEDVEISGKEIYTFLADERPVTVVLGDFSMTVGRRRVTSRDAVIWIRRLPGGAREVTAYVEGNARVREPDGAELTDDQILVTLRHRGRVTARGELDRRSLEQFPLYRRALDARREYRARREPRRPVGAPPLTVRTVPEEQLPPTQPAPRVPEAPPTQPPATTAAPDEAEPNQMPPQAEAVPPVLFRADEIVTRPARGPGEQRVSVASGDVYFSQPTPDGVLELRSQSAVVFTGERPEGADGLAEMAGVEPGEVTIAGAYLEKDVVISIGNRTLRAERAYYDFVTDRAILLDAVFRTIQEQRDIPVYIRAQKMRMLSRREMWFRDAKVSTSEFYTPTYHIGARTAYVMDTTPRDPQTGEPLAEQSIRADLRHTTFNVRGVPFLYWPWARTELQRETTSLRKVTVGGPGGDEGSGILAQWHLFRLLGLVRPEGYDGTLEYDHWFDRGEALRLALEYDRPSYGGYFRGVAMKDHEQEDDFGELRENLQAPEDRGRVLWRHKQWLPERWVVQSEVSYLRDRNFLEEYNPDEFYAGKEQETLLYAKRQEDNWALTGLLQHRLNDFQSQAESWPEVSGWWIGEPLPGGLVLYSESRAGVHRWRPDEDLPGAEDTDHFARGDTRQEINRRVRIGPVNLLPYAVGRATWWGETPDGDSEFRPYGQLGVQAATHLWRVYPDVESRLLNLHRLRHVVTPHLAAFASENGGVEPRELFPMDPGTEEHLRRLSGVSLGVYQRLQTQRGPAGARYPADWMRLNVEAGFYDNEFDPLLADGRFFTHRPEYSLS